MGILLTPFHILNINLYTSLAIITGLFQTILIYLFYKTTKSIIKTLIVSTTLTFLTFLGSPETVILSSFFLLLYFMLRDKPYSEFFIMIASFIRIDSAIYYLFARKKTAIIPILISSLLWLNGRYFLNSDLGVNSSISNGIFIFLLSYGAYIFLLPFIRLKSDSSDNIAFFIIVIFFIFFLKFPSQKIFFFPVMLTFILYDFAFISDRTSPTGKTKAYEGNKLISTGNATFRKWLMPLTLSLMIINIVFASSVQLSRANQCSAYEFYRYAESHNDNIFFGVLQPFLDYYGKKENEPYQYQISQSCSNSSDYFYAEDWRNPQLLYSPYKFCLESIKK
jgi:hypothetical protein